MQHVPKLAQAQECGMKRHFIPIYLLVHFVKIRKSSVMEMQLHAPVVSNKVASPVQVRINPGSILRKGITIDLIIIRRKRRPAVVAVFCGKT